MNRACNSLLALLLLPLTFHLSYAQPSASPTRAVTPTRIYVCHYDDSAVSVVDYPSLEEIGRYNVGAHPYYVAVSGDNRTVAVTVEGEHCIKFFDAATFAYRGRIDVGRMFATHMINLNDPNLALFSDRYGNRVMVIDLKAMTVVSTVEGVSQPHNIRIGRSGRYAYVSNKVSTGITVVDLEHDSIRTIIPMKLTPRGIAISDDERRVYCGGNWINGVFEWDAYTGKLVRVIPIPPPSDAPPLAQDTYHGLELIGDTLMVATNEGNRALDLIDIKRGVLADRIEGVPKPGAIQLLPNDPTRFIFTNMANNTVVEAAVIDGRLRLLKEGRTGTTIGHLPKRFAIGVEQIRERSER
jgi:hypothetical protein